MNRVATLSQNLDLGHCPHCGTDSPTLQLAVEPIETTDYRGNGRRFWGVYACRRCGGLVTASAFGVNAYVQAHFPASVEFSDSIPEKPRAYLEQCLRSISSPSGAVMLAASAVDAMLKHRGYTKGSLSQRINQAADDHVITAGMAKWAHAVRLPANSERHADEDHPLPDEADAAHALEFARALAEFLFVLPAKVDRGLVGVGVQPGSDTASK